MKILFRFVVIMTIAAYGLTWIGEHSDGMVHDLVGSVSGEFGQAHATAAPAIPRPAGASVSVGFSPGNAETMVVQAIKQADQSIRVAAYSFTSKPIASALVDAKKRGVDVMAVLDKSQRTARYSSATFLAHMGVPTRIDSRYAIMHNKFMVIDGKTVETGSFNYTRSAHKRNAENVIILHDQPRVAANYLKEWRRLWHESQPYTKE